jgi:hypothetical protein
LVDHAKSLVKTERRVMTAKRVVRDRVKRPARDALYVGGGTKGTNPTKDFVRGSTGEGEKKDPLGRDALVE